MVPSKQTVKFCSVSPSRFDGLLKTTSSKLTKSVFRLSLREAWFRLYTENLILKLKFKMYCTFNQHVASIETVEMKCPITPETRICIFQNIF